MRFMFAIALLAIASPVYAQGIEDDNSGNSIVPSSIPTQSHVSAEWDRTNLVISTTVKPYRNATELINAAHAIGIKKISRLTKAFSQMPVNPTGVCTIHIIAPFNESDLGHEMRHCLFGRWHQ